MCRTPDESRSPSAGSDSFACSEENQFLSNEAYHHSYDSKKQFNMSYHKTNQTSKEDVRNVTTHIAQLHAIPGFTFVVDESFNLHKTEGDKPLPHVINDLSLNMDISGGIVEGKHFRKTLSRPPTFGAGGQTSGSDLKLQRGSDRNGSYPNEMFLTVSDINLRTEPSQVPPPLRPPPKISIKQGDSKRLITTNFEASKTYDYEGAVDGCSPPFFDVEVDTNLSAAASAAAMKEAMEKAQARLKNAKESMERKRDGLQSRMNLGSKDGLKSKERQESKTSEKESVEDGGMKGFVGEEMQKATKKTQVGLDSEEREKLSNVAKASVVKKHGKEHESTQESHRQKGAIEWKAAEEFYELVKTDKLRATSEAFENTKNEKKLMRTPKAHEHEQNEMEAATEAFEQKEKSDKKLKAAKEVCEWEDERKLKAAKEACEQEHEKKLKATQDVREQEENEKKLRVALEEEETEKKLKEAHVREEHEKKLEEALEQRENEKKLKEAHEREENEKKQKEAHEREPNEKRLKEALEREERVRRLKEAREWEENEKRQKEACELEENEKRLKEVWEQADKENRLNEAHEREENERRQEEDNGREEIEMKLKLAQEDRECEEKNLKASKEAYKLDDDKNLKATQEPCRHEGNKRELYAFQEALAHEENWKIMKEAKDACEHTENEKELKAAQVENGLYKNDRLKAVDSVHFAFEHEENENRMKDATEALLLDDYEKELSELDMAIGRKQIEKNKGVSHMICDQEKLEKKLAHDWGGKGKDVKEAQVAFDWEENKNKFKAAQVVRLCENGKTAQPANMLEGKGNTQKIAREVKTSENTERKEKSFNVNLTIEEREKQERMQRERELEKERLRKIEKEREREKDRVAVERATLEARERAFVEARERAGLERATAEAQQRAMAEARERLEKTSAEAREKSLAEKVSMEARVRSERAAVERATTEARERAAEKAMAEKAASEAREWAERSVSEKYSAASRESGMRQSSSDLQEAQFQSSGSPSCSTYPNSLNHDASSENFEGAEGESARRYKARLERHQRTAVRAAKALAEKNMRDLLAQREQAERNRLAEALDADVKRWSSGKEGNLRALLSTLQYILGPDSGWHPVPLTDVITAVAVKKAYRRATLCVHPDKLQQRGANIRQKYICEKVFDLLKVKHGTDSTQKGGSQGAFMAFGACISATVYILRFHNLTE
ncbi:hypothetical protein HHK36_010154 [Tetracentron sinense]|uniref:Auxilin-like protein 1 n=1 Tax=Tetracentron sinense TaxID=13715 RepID=A0A835DIW2_TETSI|nr:hypothetical protein HHK36_010154 [Tetracentron sinense]